jgi:hypothetical protein
MNPGVLAATCLAFLVLAGCAGPDQVKPNIWLSLTPEQRAAADGEIHHGVS